MFGLFNGGRRFEVKIEEEVRRRVIEEDLELRERKKQVETETATLDALREMTALSADRIDRIAGEVRSEFKPSSSLRIIILLIVVLIAAGAAISYKALTSRESGKMTEAGLKKKSRDAQKNYAALLKAVRDGNRQMAGYLIEKGTPLHMTGNKTTALMAAVEAGYTHIINFLLEKGADVTVKELMTAVKKGDPRIAQRLLDREANIKIKDIDEVSSLLAEAEKRGKVEIVKLLSIKLSIISTKDPGPTE